jgi:hypothetical protein
MSVYWVGESRFHTVAFTNDAGAPIAMSSVSLVVTSPTGVDTTYAAPSNTGVGAYQQLVPWNAAGIWYWRWTGTVTATGAIVTDTGSVCVKDIP